MCQFFSFVTDGQGNLYYFNAKERKDMIKNNRGDYIDSHSVIASDKKLDPDKVNKYEYNPLTKVFTVDQINTEKDAETVERKVRKLNFKTIVPELIIKPIVHPFRDKNCKKVTKLDIKNLQKWASVSYSVSDSVWDSVSYSVWDSVRNSVWDSVSYSVRASVSDSVRNSVWDSVRNSVWDSVSDSVRASVRNSVWDSVSDSVWAYSSSFFSIKYKYDFSCCVKLWEKGLVPSFNGLTWCLHGGKDAKVLFEINKDKLMDMNKPPDRARRSENE